MNTTSVEVTAGLGGFLVLFALALAVWFLGRDLTRRLRRMNRAEEQRRSVAPADDAVVGDGGVGDAVVGRAGDDATAGGAGATGETAGAGEPGAGTGGPVPPRADA